MGQLSSILLWAEISPWLAPIWLALVGGIGALGLLVACYFLLKLVFPKLAAIALTTTQEAVSQPLFGVSLAIGCFLLVVVFPFLPYNTFGEDVKMVKDGGLTTIMLLAILVALWSASVSVSEEIEGRTALTLLSKPIGRRQFVIGKFLGIVAASALILIILGVVFLGTVSYKVVYDAKESALPLPTVRQCRAEMLQIVPGLLLALMETTVLAAISVAISTRLPMLPNLLICMTIYALGHLVPLLVDSSIGRFEIVQFIGQLIATLLPNLDYFNIQAAVATGKVVPLGYLGWTALYCALYCTFALLAALVLFEDRDLA